MAPGVPLLVMLVAGAGAVAPASRHADQDAIAETLGRAHALHRLCAGAADDVWRARMQALLVAERATPAQRNRLVGRFNAGFAGAGRRYPVCSSGSRAALAETARRGREQATALAQGTR